MSKSVDEPRRLTAKAQATRQRLIETATELFAERGYERTSMRAVGDELGMTTGAVYAHFRNKAELLAAAVAHSITVQIDRSQEPEGKTYLQGAANLFARHRQQVQLRALLLAAAAAADADEAVRDRLRTIQLDRMEAWTAVAQRDRAAGRLGADIDVEALVKVLWALEFGLVIFDVFGIEPPDAEQTGRIVERLFHH